jgi:hypothetical protein
LLPQHQNRKEEAVIRFSKLTQDMAFRYHGVWVKKGRFRVLASGVKEAVGSVIQAICCNESGVIQEKGPDLSVRLHLEATHF